MDEMYSMSIDIHSFGIIFLLLIVLFNLLLLFRASDIFAYAKRMRRLMPLSGSMLALILFTGAIMMAAKHLSFTLENILMILFAVIIIVLEGKRYGSLKHMDLAQTDAFSIYKRKAYRLLFIELGLILPISFWMYLQ